jgi:hypothetical protein
MEASFKMQQNIGIANDGESDELKRVFLEGNPVLLAITMVVSMLHSVFDFLAFKNDVAFWKENKSMEGLSARSIMINAVCQAIIFLYLLDNDTSMVVLLSSGEAQQPVRCCLAQLGEAGEGSAVLGVLGGHLLEQLELWTGNHWHVGLQRSRCLQHSTALAATFHTGVLSAERHTTSAPLPPLCISCPSACPDACRLHFCCRLRRCGHGH